jgi:hypothetical protein
MLDREIGVDLFTPVRVGFRQPSIGTTIRWNVCFGSS